MKSITAILAGFMLVMTSGCTDRAPEGNPFDPPLWKYESELQQYDNPPRYFVDGDLHIQGTIKTYELPPMYPPEGTVPYRDEMTTPASTRSTASSGVDTDASAAQLSAGS